MPGVFRLIETGKVDPSARNFAPVEFLGAAWRGTDYHVDFSVPVPPEQGAIRPVALWVLAAPDGTDPGAPIDQLFTLSEAMAPRFKAETNRRTGDFTVVCNGIDRPFQRFTVAEY